MCELIPICDDHSDKALNRLLLEKALRCPECGAYQTSLAVMSDRSIVRPNYLIACKECDYQGPFGRSIYHAVKQWNKPPGFFASFLKKRRAIKHVEKVAPL